MERTQDYTLRSFFDGIYVLERSLKAETIRQLRMSIDTFLEFTGRDVLIDELNETMINKWILANPRKWAPATLRRRRSDILALWSYASEIDLATNEPRRRRIRRIPVPRRIPRAWTSDELGRMLAACRLPQMARFLPNGVRLGVLAEVTLRVGYDTALRCDDLMRIKVESLTDGEFIAEQEKKHGSEIMCRVRESTLQLIRDNYPREVDLVVAWPYSRDHFYAGCWHVMLKLAGLPTKKTEGLQKLRRTSVSHAERLGAGHGALQAGHAPGSKVTADHYIDPRVAYGNRPLPPDMSVKDALSTRREGA